MNALNPGASPARLTDLLSPERIGLFRPTGFQGPFTLDRSGQSQDKPLDKRAAIHTLARMLASDTTISASQVEQVLLEREALQSTGIGEGVAIPHGAIAELTHQSAALLIVPAGLEFSAIDQQKVTLLFAVIGPKRATGEHLKTLARVSRLLRNREFRDQLVNAPSPAEAFRMIDSEEREFQ